MTKPASWEVEDRYLLLQVARREYQRHNRVRAIGAKACEYAAYAGILLGIGDVVETSARFGWSAQHITQIPMELAADAASLTLFGVSAYAGIISLIAGQLTHEVQEHYQFSPELLNQPAESLPINPPLNEAHMNPPSLSSVLPLAALTR